MGNIKSSFTSTSIHNDSDNDNDDQLINIKNKKPLPLVSKMDYKILYTYSNSNI